MKRYLCCALFFTFLYVRFAIVHGDEKSASNPSAVCLRCLCYASTLCNATIGCQKQYCGLFFITKEIWTDAGRPTLPDDDPDRTSAFNDCAKDYACASKAVIEYMAKNSLDCNNDGVINCDDYARILFYGKDKCSMSIANLHYGKRYSLCQPIDIPSIMKEERIPTEMEEEVEW